MVLIVSFSLAAATDVPAEEPKASKASTADEERDSREYKENVVVTATRGERPAELVPISVSAISAQQIEEAPAVRVDDLLREVPGLDMPLGSSAVQYPTQQTFSMRGPVDVPTAFALLIAISTEIAASKTGLGRMLWMAWETFRIEQLYAGLAMVSAVGVGFNLLWTQVARRLLPWQHP